ncbi:hypothetical protein [Martelella alba]|nr:hypothetical protein [Martelella alba]
MVTIKNSVIAAAVFAFLPLTFAASGASAMDDGVASAIQSLGLTDISQQYRNVQGVAFRGILPDGTPVRVNLDRNGDITEVEARDKLGFEARQVEAIVPEAVQANPAYPAQAKIWKLELHDGELVAIKGYIPGTSAVDAEFGPNGDAVGVTAQR